MATFVLTVVGDDRPGLVSALSGAVADHGGNWLTSRMAQLAGQFAGIVLVEVPAERAEALREALAGLTASGLRVAVTLADDLVGQPGPEVRADPAGARRILALSLLGDDRPGIVRQLTSVLAAHGVSVDELETGTREAPMAGGLLFEATARLSVPAEVDLDAVRAALEQIAGELLVDLDLNDR